MLTLHSMLACYAQKILNHRRACRQFPLSRVMLNRKPRAAASCCMLALICLIGCMFARALPGPLPADSTRQGDTTSRFVVSFREDHKQTVKQHLLKKSYNILSEGIDFFVITHHGSERKSLTAAAVTHAAVSAAAAPRGLSQAAASPVPTTFSSRGRRLAQRRQQQQCAEHLLALQDVPGGQQCAFVHKQWRLEAALLVLRYAAASQTTGQMACLIVC